MDKLKRGKRAEMEVYDDALIREEWNMTVFTDSNVCMPSYSTLTYSSKNYRINANQNRAERRRQQCEERRKNKRNKNGQTYL